ncbi:ion channel [Neolewinella antarctica]|uniref:Solute-binding protein family 3/N-terminal domain-containing protein n=1 Tax=Neolewinella antarctica TaxID=442734 RepID=A0ABX0XC59_9BACT|nr:transporter substrate-binding domain-containing protein [Neolewinella antarctica]NJC26861.1 hypothetical protein [Neolewinella antarctica]
MKTTFFRLLLLSLLFIPTLTFAQGEGEELIKVGVMDSPPYCIKGAEGNWSGLSVELWRHLADKEHLNFEWVEFDDLKALKKGITDGKVSVSIASNLDGELVDNARFLQHHYMTTLGVGRPIYNKMWNTFRNVFSMQLLWIVLSLSGLLLIIGTAIYFIERGENEDQFGGDRSLWEGIGSGFWWAGVTMTTIGYGDKAPMTLGGRILAMLWMLVALGVSASLTASIVSAIGENNVISFPDDLTDMRVAVPENSPAADFLTDEDYEFTEFKGIKKSLRSLKEQDFDIVVGDATALRYVINNNSNISASVTATNTSPISYAIMVREDSGLYDRLDQHLVKFILSPTYRRMMQEYGNGIH